MKYVFSPDEVRARWAYSELLSLGHGDRYAGEGVPELREKARNGVPFEKLGDAEYYLLVDQFEVGGWSTDLQRHPFSSLLCRKAERRHSRPSRNVVRMSLVWPSVIGRNPAVRRARSTSRAA